MNPTPIEKIISAIQTATGLMPVYKGGNCKAPIEYTFVRYDAIQYRLEINLTGKDYLALQTLQRQILDAICNFYDEPKIEGIPNISMDGGGTAAKDGLIVLTSYFDIETLE